MPTAATPSSPRRPRQRCCSRRRRRWRRARASPTRPRWARSPASRSRRSPSRSCPTSTRATSPAPSRSSRAPRARWASRSRIKGRAGNAMSKHGKNYRNATGKVEKRPYHLREALEALKNVAYAKFDETIEVAMRLGVDPRHADQMVRGTVVLPHGTGKSMRVLVFATGEKMQEARDAGADFVGSDELVEKITGGWMDFDAVVATPDMMRVVGRLGKVLGPRGLMPNPKAGSVTFDVGKAVGEIKGG